LEGVACNIAKNNPLSSKIRDNEKRIRHPTHQTNHTLNWNCGQCDGKAMGETKVTESPAWNSDQRAGRIRGKLSKQWLPTT